MIKKYFLCAYFPLIPPKSVYLIRKKCASAKFSGIFPTEKMALQNFPAFFKLKKCFCKIFQHLFYNIDRDEIEIYPWQAL